MILNEIVAHKKSELDRLKADFPVKGLIQGLKMRIKQLPPTRDFIKAVKGKGIKIIAEVKKASPSKGVIRKDFDPIEIARIYEINGAAAISVLTEERYFHGHIDYLKEIKGAVSIPVLRKDFIFDEYQVYEAFLAEADALLLIVAALEKQQLKSLLSVAHALNLECLVETHSDEEIKIALDAGANIIGINARNLKTFVLDKTLFKKYAHLIPSGRVKVAESGLENSNDLKEVYSKGANAALIGTSIMSSNNIQQKLKDLTNF